MPRRLEVQCASGAGAAKPAGSAAPAIFSAECRIRLRRRIVPIQNTLAAVMRSASYRLSMCAISEG